MSVPTPSVLPDLLPACDRLDSAIASDLVIRRFWTREEGGRHLACLLATLVPECGEQRTISACPATVMPRWLAELTPWLDDSGSVEAYPTMIREFARLLRASQSITADAWSRLDYQFRAIAVREARSHECTLFPSPFAITVLDRLIDLLDRAAAGELALLRELDEVERVAWESVGVAGGSPRSAAASAVRAVAAIAVRKSVKVAWAALAADRITSMLAADRITSMFFEEWGQAVLVNV